MIDTENIIKGKVEYLKNVVKNVKPEYNKPLVVGIRCALKELLKNEFEKLPETLKDLEPVHCLNVLCKLILYVLLKVEAVYSEKATPKQKKQVSQVFNGIKFFYYLGYNYQNKFYLS